MKQISNFKKSIPDGERFLQEPLSQCSCRRANAYIGGHLPTGLREWALHKPSEEPSQRKHQFTLFLPIQPFVV